MDAPRVQVIAETESLPPSLSTALERTRAAVTVNGFDEACNATIGAKVDAVVVVIPEDQASVRPQIEQILSSLARRPCGTLVLAPTALNGVGSVERPPELPISFAVAPTEDELTARLETICEYGGPLRHITHQARSRRQPDRQLADDTNGLDEQLSLAGQVQRDFLPRRVPDCEGVRFTTLYRPADYVSGDIYDLTRLDETHIGLAVADVTGHGVPAALLTLFVKRACQAKEIRGNTYRIIPPDELLARLNRDVLEADLEQCQFVTACCAVFDQTHRIITWARGGLPYPILVRAGQRPRQIRSTGKLVGAFDDAQFELCQEQLRPGDVMIFFTDGLEALLLGDSRNQRDRIEQTEWFAKLSEGSPEEHIADVDRRLNDIPDDAWPRDDVTIVAISIDS